MEKMGCDIQLFLEYKSPITKEWQPFGYGYYIPSNYNMFAKMAGVRTDGRGAIFQAKGLPDGLSDYVNTEYEKVKDYEECCHDPSWLSQKEFNLCIDSYDINSQKDILEYKALLATMTLFEKYECETRIVFWFIL